MYIFVYGSLKKGFSNHQLLGSSKFICNSRTLEEFAMLDFDLFPGVIREKKVSRIHGEVYDLDTDTLEKIDIYEGDWYARKDVELEAEFKAQMYFLIKYPWNPEKIQIISEGVWTKKLSGEFNNVG